MSGSTEIPDYVGKLANAVGLDKLWQSSEQADSERRQEEHEYEDKHEHFAEDADDGVGHHKGQQADHDIEIHGVPRPRSPTEDAHRGKKGYEWPMPASAKDNEAKVKLDSQPTQSEKVPNKDHTSSPQAEKQRAQNPEAQDDEEEHSKWHSMFPSFRRASEFASPPPRLTESPEPMPERPRPQTSASQQSIPKTKRLQRQYTMPAPSSAEREAAAKTKARSRWQAAAHGLRFPIRRKRTNTRDSTRGAGVITTLIAGAPAANLVASHMLTDEHGHHRIPVIVDLLKIHISDSWQTNRGHTVYRIDLTYGEGPSHMKWTVEREHRDFQSLHNRLRLLYLRRREKLPEFPSSTFPFWLGNFGASTSSKDGAKKDIKESISQELGPGIAAGIGALAGAVGGGVHDMKKKDIQMMARLKLQEYLTQMFLFLRWRPGLNRLCKFLELSTLGIRLASENSYHGKEGWLVIASAKGSNAAIRCNPRLYKRRHTPKWFMVRHSYIVAVEDMEGLNIYDVLLVDSEFKVEWHALPGLRHPVEESRKDTRHHFFTISNAERTFKLASQNDKKMMQFIDSIRMMKEITPWSQKHRFGSFAPVRYNCQCQWLVDGRDYFWNVSRAILKARDVIYIHDWWLSPELHLRRPAANGQKWRLDRLLQRKAQEGVKIYVIIYQNVGTTVPIDSTHTKYSLLGLHPNVFVQRSPRHVGGLGAQNVFFWAHHEKVISIDHTVGFVGGLDLCYGRWDSPEHVLSDDKPLGFDEGVEGKLMDDPQIWPGKDYSNPRIRDFFELDKPYEDMYDRKQTPRMPWHDIAMQVTGQPARDIARHFVQRWNYLLRTKPPTKPTPILLPPPEFTAAELEHLDLNGTCEFQLLRSAGAWSLGLQETEQSIQNAYIKVIEQSEHFVYIENQFFITSCDCDGTKIENQIGDAIVNRIIRAHKEGTDWRCVILIPLMPGFQNTIDSPDGSSLRLIMYAQYYSLSRGETSIFGKLRAQDIDPEDYVSIYALRGWGKIGDQDQLVTEQVYIHAKMMIVDDRIAIIGSANINERSMRGNRDSEVAAIVRDMEQYEVTMAGKPFMVGKFAHTLRMRLQLEHLGVNTDDFEQRVMMMDGLARRKVETMHSWEEKAKTQPNGHPPSPNDDGDWLDEKDYHVVDNPDDDSNEGDDLDKESRTRKVFNKLRPQRSKSPNKTEPSKIGRPSVTTSANPLPGAIPPNMRGQDSQVDRAEELEQAKRDPDVVRNSTSASSGEVSDKTLSEEDPSPTSPAPGLASPKPLVHHGDGGSILPTPPKISRVTDLPIPIVDPYNIVDPLEDEFFFDQWDAVAKHNTAVYRRVFHPMPDNEVKTWSEFKEYFAYGERLAKAEGGEKGKLRIQREQPGASGPVGALGAAKLNPAGKLERKNRDSIKEYAEGGQQIHEEEKKKIEEDLKETKHELTHEESAIKDDVKHFGVEVKDGVHEMKDELEHTHSKGSVDFSAVKRRRAKSLATKAGNLSILPRDTMEELLREVQGHLVVWPTDWLAREDANGNFLYNIDKVQPMEIFD